MSPALSPPRSATSAVSSAALSAWSIAVRPLHSPRIPRPTSIAKMTFWFDSAWNWRPVTSSRRAVALVGAQPLELGVAAAHAQAAEARVLAALAPQQVQRTGGVDVGVDVDRPAELLALLA